MPHFRRTNDFRAINSINIVSCRGIVLPIRPCKALHFFRRVIARLRPVLALDEGGAIRIAIGLQFAILYVPQNAALVVVQDKIILVLSNFRNFRAGLVKNRCGILANIVGIVSFFNSGKTDCPAN